MIFDRSILISNGNSCIVADDYVTINGEVLPPVPGGHKNITVINGKVYINGYEYKRGKWRRTIKAMWHYIWS